MKNSLQKLVLRTRGRDTEVAGTGGLAEVARTDLATRYALYAKYKAANETDFGRAERLVA